MVNFVGLFFVLLGFVSPFLTNGKLPPQFVFWLGFLLLFWYRSPFVEKYPVLKWGRKGLMVNILGTLILVLLSLIETKFFLGKNVFFAKVSTIFEIIAKPTTIIIAYLSPYRYKSINGAFQYHISFLRGTIFDFIDILILIIIAMIIGKLFLKGRFYS